MDPEQALLLESMIKQHGSARVLQAILQAHPELRDQILSLVAEVGPDLAVQQMLQLPPESTPPEPEISQKTVLPGASPEITSQAAGAMAEAIPQTLSGLPEVERPVNLVGLGVPPPEKFQTSPGQREMGIAPQPVSIEVPRPEPMAPTSDRLPQQVEPEAPAQMTIGEPPAMDVPPAELPDVNNILTQLPPASILPGLAMAEQISLKERWKSMGPNASSFSTLCAQHKLPMEVVVAMVKHESNFDPSATSDAGAMGLLQLMPGTARDQGLKVTTKLDERLMPKKNLSAGLNYLSWLKSNYKPETLDRLLAAYNAGPGRLKDNAWQKIPETTSYVNKIKKTVQIYRDDPGEFGKDLSSLLQHLQ